MFSSEALEFLASLMTSKRNNLQSQKWEVDSYSMSLYMVGLPVTALIDLDFFFDLYFTWMGDL